MGTVRRSVPETGKFWLPGRLTRSLAVALDKLGSCQPDQHIRQNSKRDESIAKMTIQARHTFATARLTLH